MVPRTSGEVKRSGELHREAGRKGELVGTGVRQRRCRHLLLGLPVRVPVPVPVPESPAYLRQHPDDANEQPLPLPDSPPPCEHHRALPDEHVPVSLVHGLLGILARLDVGPRDEIARARCLSMEVRRRRARADRPAVPKCPTRRAARSSPRCTARPDPGSGTSRARTVPRAARAAWRWRHRARP